MTGTMMKIIMRNFYIIGRSSEPYTQQQNNCEGHIRRGPYQDTPFDLILWYIENQFLIFRNSKFN